MITIKPDYYNNFKCLMGACPSSCCTLWQIDIDNKSLDYYNNLNTPYGDYIRSKIEYKEDEYRIKVCNGRCSFLNDENLCDMYINIGPEHGADTCRNFPKVTVTSEDIKMESQSAACPDVAESIVLAKNLSFSSQGICSDEYDREFVRIFNSLIAFVKDKKDFLGDTKALVDFAAEQQQALEMKFDLEEVCIPQDNSDIESYMDALSVYPGITEGWKEIREKMNAHSFSEEEEKDFLEYIKGREEPYKNIFLYFVHRHILDFIYDDNVYLPIRFAVVSLRVLYYAGMLLYSEKGKLAETDLTRLLYLYSKEMEHDDETIFGFYDDLSLGMI